MAWRKSLKMNQSMRMRLPTYVEVDVVTSDIHIAHQVPRCNKNTSNQISNYFKLYFTLLYYLLDCKQSLFFLRSWWAASINPQMHIIIIGYTTGVHLLVFSWLHFRHFATNGTFLVSDVFSFYITVIISKTFTSFYLKTLPAFVTTGLPERKQRDVSLLDTLYSYN